jgi:hypothetical protein
MNKPDVQKIYNSVMSGTEGMYEDVIASMEEYGKQMFNYALYLASKNAVIAEMHEDETGDYTIIGQTVGEVVNEEAVYIIDKESILNIKP